MRAEGRVGKTTTLVLSFNDFGGRNPLAVSYLLPLCYEKESFKKPDGN